MHKNDQRRGRCLGLAVLALACWGVAAAAGPGETTLPLTPGVGEAQPGPRFDVTGFTLRGSVPLLPGRVQAVLAPFVGPGASLGRLHEAVAALESALRAEGLGLYRVRLLPQVLQGEVLMEIQPLRIGQVEVRGALFSGETEVRRALPALALGTTPHLHHLAAQTALANDSPVRQLQVLLQEGRSADAGDRVDVQIQVRDQRPWRVSASFSNHGSPATGQDRFTLSGRHADLGGQGADLQLAHTTSLEQPHSVKQFGAALRLPLYALGWQLSAQYTRSDMVGDFGGFTSTGAGHAAGLDCSMYLPLGGQIRHQVGLFMQDRLYESTRIDGQLVPGQFDRRSRPVGLRYAGRREDGGAPAEAGAALRGDWQWGAEWLVNTGWGRGNDLFAYQSEDPRIDRLRWQALRLSLAHARTLAGWRLSMRTQGQLASTALILGDQFGLGGLGSVRGTREERPLAGDSGWQGSAELATPALEGWQLAGFVDAGGIANRPASEGRGGRDHLASAGLGLRWGRPGLNLVLDWGRIIRGSRMPQALLPSAPQRGDERLYLALTLGF